MHLFQAVGPIEGNSNVDENVCALSDDRKFSASFVSIASVIEDIGTFAVETLDALDVVEKNQLFENVSKCVVNLKLAAAIGTRSNSANKVSISAPSSVSIILIASTVLKAGTRSWS